jgi:glycerol uptake facilitator-like aquaporin
MLGRYSGAHFNPAISIILRIQGLRVGKDSEFNALLETVCYIFSQVAGSILGIKIARAGHSVYPVYRLEGFMEEVLLTTILLFLVIIWSREGKLCPFAQPLSGIVMGGGVTFLAILGGLTSSGIFNPAISVGMMVGSGQQGIQLMIWAQLLAVAFVGLVIRAYQSVR